MNNKTTLHIAYKRVSTTEQNLDRQLAGSAIPFSFIYEEKVSAKDTNRPELQKLLHDQNLSKLHNVTLHIHSLDRLARNLADLLSLVEAFKAKGWSICFHKENLTFSGSSTSPMDTLMLQMLGSFAQFERNLMLERQREGIAVAKAQGKYKGRKAVLSQEQILALRDKACQPGANKAQLAKDFGISRASLYNYLEARHQPEVT
jgi:DNA invertase Pin-like site-specific DNA recombinase